MSNAKTANWSDRVSSPILLVSGPEEFLAARTIRNIREQLRAIDPNLEVTSLEAAEYQAGQIFDFASPSLFNEPRLLIINSVERCTDALISDGIEYLVNPTPDTTVVFRHVTGVRGKKLLESLRASEFVTEVNCLDITKDSDRLAFAAAEFRSAARKTTPGALRMLCDAFSEGLAELAGACQQLLEDSSETIDEKLVERYYSGRVETNSFKVADAAIAGNTGEALTLLRHAISTGADPVPMVAAFAMRMRLLAKLFDNRSASAATLGVKPWQIDKARRELAGWQEEDLVRVIQELATTDAAAKGAERDPVFALERLVILIANRGRA